MEPSLIVALVWLYIISAFGLLAALEAGELMKLNDKYPLAEGVKKFVTYTPVLNTLIITYALLSFAYDELTRKSK